jgi:uncharacterized membrane protein YqjE
MSNDNTSSSNDSNNEDKEDKEENKPEEPDILKEKLNTLKRVAIYALFLFVKISCFIFINANIIFFFTYLFDRIYYKKFTLANSNIKTDMVREFIEYLETKFPTDRTTYPYKTKKINNKLLSEPYKAGSNTGGTPGGAPGGTPVGTPGGFNCEDGKGKGSCDGADAATAEAPAQVKAGGGQKGGKTFKIFDNLNNFSKKILEGIKPVNNVKKTIDHLYNKIEAREAGLGASAEGELDSSSLDYNKLNSVNIKTCESVNCDDIEPTFPFKWKGPNGFFGDYIQIHVACIGRTQIAINNKVKNTIKSFNNLLPAFCYCSKDETDFISGISKQPNYEKDLKENQVYREDPEKIEINCIVRNEFYNGIYMVFGIFISIFYLIYWDLYVNITLFINHIILFFEIKKYPEGSGHIKTSYRKTLQLFILLMSPFIFLTNRIIAFVMMIQITYKLWVQPLFEKKNKKRLSRILFENRTIIAFMFVFSYLLLLYTIQLPPNYELPVKILPTLVLTIIVLIKIIQAFYRMIKNYKASPTTCKKNS